MTRWKSFRYRLEELGCAWLARQIPRLPRRGAVRLGHVLGRLAYLLDRRGRAVALANADCIYGDTLDARAKQALILSSYRNFARTMIDLFWGQRLTAKNFRTWVKTEGMGDLHTRLAATGKGAVFMCVHQGNWEWAGLIGSFVGLQMTTVAENFKNPRLSDIFTALREHTGQKMIPQESSLLRMLKVVKKGGLTAMLIDLNLQPSQAATIVEAFGGLQMCVPLLHAVLGQRGGALLIPAETELYDDGTYRVRAHPPVEFPPDATLPEIAQACWSRMEELIRARPHHWLWPYKHFRYQPKDTRQKYPYYANTSGKFEKLRRDLQAMPSAGKKRAAPTV